ncbi:protein FAR1-RELATED SEQUENCE 6 [Sesamum alatum]|uniref:Protein FAR1-RELATED SEQUENCE n=1 Tax=Sesamum alatum TaxID=300844 RepID=A0AAE1YDA3_9LAMI|nr:protein FAR1-RELATED SEQUENCE 6 [Sesamum alatum]
MDEVSLNGEPAYDDEAEEFEIDGECAMTEYVGQTGNILLGDNPLPPAVGMEFESYDDVYYFYNCYAKQQGFGVRVSNTWYRKSKERYRGKLSCSSAGFKKKSEASRPRPETRTGCPAMIKFRLMENKRWRIIEVELEHNHLTSPTSSKVYKSHRIMDLGSKRPLPMDGSEEVGKIRLFRTVVIDAEDNGIASFDEGDFGNNIDQSDNKLNLKQGDAQEMLDFFTRMQLSSPSFFYVMDINEKGCLRNAFWAETRSRPAYGYFGDIMFIDTTTLIEKYEVPLVVFTGVNHHAQPMSLGCGLVSSQTVESFTWLFRAWLTYMVGRPPQTVITSQCKALQTAISEVFPRAFHCLSLTNIMQKFPSELGRLEEYDAIRKAFTRAVYHSSRVDEFEAAWEEMVQSYRLMDHKWLQIVYEDRKRWIPVYLKEVFLAGMFTVKENERLTSPFEEYLSRHTSLKQFFSSYDQALLEINQRETLSDLESNNSSCTLKSRFYFELQLSRLYTNSIFKKFQDEIEGMYTCFSVRQMNIDGSVATYIVKEDIQVEEKRRETRDFEVMYNASDAEVVCACGLFNLRGYLCRHALSVINQIGLEEIPPQYILARWRKDINHSYIFNHGLNGIDVNNPVHRYDNLYKCALKVVEEGRKSHDRYKFTSQSLDEILNKVRI